MGIRNLSENIMLVTVPTDRLERTDELNNINEIISENSGCDVIIDFEAAEIINSWNISNLLILRDMLEKAGRKLVLCNINTATRCIFVVSGLSDTFVFADDRTAAMEIIKQTNSKVSAKPS